MFYIFDIDNCISDDSWRVPRIRWHFKDPDARYNEYHELAPFDKPWNTHLFNIDPASKIIYFTARPERYRIATIEWLSRNVAQRWETIYMRSNDNHEHSASLKEKMLLTVMQQFEIGKTNIVCAYDDRSDVIDMYRAHDIKAERVWIHDHPVWSQEDKP